MHYIYEVVLICNEKKIQDGASKKSMETKQGYIDVFIFYPVKINLFVTYILAFNSLRLLMTTLLYFYAIFDSVNYTKPVCECDYFTIVISF